MKTATEKDQKFAAYDTFRRSNETEHGYLTEDQALESARLKMAWWGSNLVFLGVSKNKQGYFNPGYNVWD
jgi:hypothetical protein